MQDHWADMIGMLRPAAALVMAFLMGMLGAAIHQIFRLSEGARLTNLLSLVAGASAIQSLLMIAACGRRWFREYSGPGKSLSTFAVSLGVVGTVSAAGNQARVACSVATPFDWAIFPESTAVGRPLGRGRG